jgi:hypothetical protein
MAVSMMKDEAPYILEWVAHHLAVGFTDILVYTNDCTDGTVEMLQRLEALGIATHRENVIAQGRKPQPSAIRHAQEEPLVAAADWLMLLDADEFLCINHASGTLDGMLDDTVARGANGIVVTWRVFGSAGRTAWSRAPVTEDYTRAAPRDWNKGWGVKTLFRFDPEHWKLGIHRPTIRNKWLDTGFPDSVRWLNGSGRPMEDYFKFRGWRSIRRTVGFDWAQVNHYAVKSVEAYAARRLRGNVNDKKDKYDAGYWALQDRNEVEDTAALRHADARAGILSALLNDPVLAELHRAAHDRIEARLARLRTTPDYRALARELAAASRTPIAQVSAKPPKPRDPARIEALMSEVEARTLARARPVPTDPFRRRCRFDDPAAPWVANHGICLPADPGIFEPAALAAVSAGRFDRRHARHAGLWIDGHRRLLEIGTGIAFLPLRALTLDPGLSAVAQEAREDLLSLARVVAERAPAEVGRRLVLSDAPVATAADLTSLIERSRATLLRIARPAELPGDAPEALASTSLERIVVPAATPADADALRARLSAPLRAHGFHEVPERAAQGSLQFDRRGRAPLADPRST